MNEEYAKIRELLLERKYAEIVALGMAAIPHLIDALKDEDGFACILASHVLGEIAEKRPACRGEVVPALIDALKHESQDVRRNAAAILGRAGAVSAVPALTGALGDEKESVREMAASAIGAIAEKGGDCSSAVPALIRAFSDHEGRVRHNCVWALERVGVNKEQRGSILKMLGRGTWEGRETAAYALEKFGDASAVPALAGALHDPCEGVGTIAARALKKIGLDEIEKTEDRIRCMLLLSESHEIAVMGDGVIPVLMTALNDKNRIVTRAAVSALAEIGNSAVLPLLDALRGKDLEVVKNAAEALGRIGDMRAIPALINLLNNNPEVGATEALAKIGKPAVDVLIDILKISAPEMREVAARTLGVIKNASAVPALVEALKDSKWYVQRSAAGALAKIAEETEIDLRAVQKALEEFVDSVKKWGKPVEVRTEQKRSGGYYIQIAEAARKRAAAKQSLAGDGVILVGELPRPPSGKMYRAAREARAFV